MCELLGLSSNLPATVSVSIGTLAGHGKVGGSLNDGWGVAYCESTDVRLIKDSQPAGDSDWVRYHLDRSAEIQRTDDNHATLGTAFEERTR